MKTNAHSALRTWHFIEPLEARIAPANITAVVSGHLLKIIGTTGDNAITIEAVIGDSTSFVISSSTDTVNGMASFTTPSGVTDISIKTLGGDSDPANGDTVKFDNMVAPIHLKGSATVVTGDGPNQVFGADLTVGKNLSITNGNSPAFRNAGGFSNLNVGGNVTVKNGSGTTTDNLFVRTSMGVSSIGGNLSITNGDGSFFNEIEDINIRGNVTIKNGHGGTAGLTGFFNVANTNVHSIIGGNVSVSYPDGSGFGCRLNDTDVLGNVTFNFGNATTGLDVDGDGAGQAIIRGNLTVKSKGATTVDIGEDQKAGLIVDKKLTILGGDGGDGVTFNKLQVGGAVSINVGNGANTLKIDDSIFGGAFTFTDKLGKDTIDIETTTGTSLATIFEQSVVFHTGAQSSTTTLAGSTDLGQFLVIEHGFTIHTGPTLSTLNETISHEWFPFGGSVQKVV